MSSLKKVVAICHHWQSSHGM